MPGGPLGGRRTVGRLRHRVTIQTPAAAANAYGEFQPQTWGDLATVWCQVMVASGRELFASGQVQAQVSHRVTMRHRTDFAAKDRLVWIDGGNDVVLNVVAVLPSVGAANYLDVWCLAQG